MENGPSEDGQREETVSADDIKEGPVLKRPRSSYDNDVRQTSLDANNLVDVDGKLMRLRQDPLDYPRRRATIACEICRSRKSRCDGTRPKCKLCIELGADCVYREPGVKLDAGDKMILERLARIEGLLLDGQVSSGAAAASTSPTASSNTMSDDVHHGHKQRLSSTSASARVPSVPLNGLGTWSANISTMPKAHTTPALHLLHLPVIVDLVSRPCDPQVLLQLEMSREPLDLNLQPSLDLTNTGSYVQAFFERVNTWYACVNPYLWHSYYRNACNAGFGSGAESAIVLLVIALGQAAQSGQSISRLPSQQNAPGIVYFSAAWNLLPSLMTRNDILSAQCHILASAYLLYLVRPLEAWNLLYNTSMKLQLLLSSQGYIPPQLKELSVRVYWNTLMIESDLLAELDLPHSGIVQFEESMRLPRSFTYDPTTSAANEPPSNDELGYFLHEIGLRRLLNRVSHLIYTTKRSTDFSVSSLEPVVAELDYQLTHWYENLPAPVKFPRERLPTQSQVQTVLRLRYFACRTIIFRPYILAVLADESVAQTPAVQDACRKCLEATLRQLENISAHHEGHLPYLWQGALSIVSQTLLLMGATLSNGLAALLPPAHQMSVIIAGVVAEVERLSHLAPSLQLCADIIREAENRRQQLQEQARG